jgi:lysozyme family protein
MITYIIDYKQRGYKYTAEIKAVSQKEAMEIFAEKYPNGKILNIQKL